MAAYGVDRSGLCFSCVNVMQILERWRAAGEAPAPEVRWHSASSVLAAAIGPDAATADGADRGFVATGIRPPPSDVSQWLVLGIESSCDDTAAAVVCGDGTVRSHRIASQVKCVLW